MTIDDQSLFDWAFKGIVGLLVTILSWIAGKQIKNGERTQKELDDHRLYSAKNYIEKDAMDRVHDRIDEVSNDIKTLLTRTGKH